MENSELLKRLEELVMDNENLKLKNIELTRKLGDSKNWTGIREGELMPRLNKRYGAVSCMHPDMLNPVSQIIRSLLNIKKLSEVDESNYEIAKEIAVNLVETICKYDWLHLQELQELWKRNNAKIGGN